ncbi:cytochrome P450 [Teratosphaeria nubilosa]|uniref:Cytochrome P450 n=1 Tax=Teratosphaeria nubilosa TaxID=161662 RepID=A0A6G1LGF0_9PEZI|nr:cytochrome P450 [Teratosphaeria nubilosa]
MDNVLTSTRLSWAIGAIIATAFIRFIQQWYFHRKLVRGLPGPPHSWIWGHLRAMNEIQKEQPKLAAPQTFWGFVKDKYNLGDYFYLDPWPFGDPIMIILDTDVAHQVTVKHSAPKHPEVAKFIYNVGGPGNLVSSEGAEWKKWRTAFNPGFASSHIMSVVPTIIDECLIFNEILTTRAKNDELFRMERDTTRLTVDIIGKVTLDYALDCQKGPNELVDAFMNQVRWQCIGVQFNPWEMIDWPFRISYQRWLTYKMDRYIKKRLNERFATREQRGKSRAVVDLALQEYLKEVKGMTDDVSKVQILDPEFEKAVINNMKVFLFAGHDTTSSAIAYAYYYLSKNSKCLAKIRKEHDDVFGTDPSSVAEQLRRDPRLLNKLEYTLAVIREVLRLQPPASTVRIGEKGLFARDPATNEPLPTEHFMLWPVDVGLHRHPKYWSNPHDFIPERHIHNSSDESANYKSNPAWVAFSKGPRNCVGQELAIVETKTILAMTLRTFDFSPAGYPSYTEGVQEQFGEEAYQIQLGTAKPREGMPCRIRLRSV